MTTGTLDTNKLFALLGQAFFEMAQSISSIGQKDLNAVPFEESWTAGQLTSHVIKSNKGIVQALEMQGKASERNPVQEVNKIKKMFLDFNVKYKSPEFIMPAKGPFNKESLIAEYNNSCEQIKLKANRVDLCEIISLPAFGETTKVEMLYFVVYHTQRHIHQLKSIIKK